MRSTIVFLLLFGGCVLAAPPSQTIVLDTNACSEVHAFFKHVIKSTKIDELAYDKVWNKFWPPEGTTPEDFIRHIDSKISEYYTDYKVPEKEQMNLNRGASVMKLILDLDRNKNAMPVKIDIPVFVYNEVARSFTSKIGKDPGDKKDFTKNYDAFFSSIPLSDTSVAMGTLQPNTDFPPKKTDNSESMEEIMKIFLTDTAASNHHFRELLDYLRYDKGIEKGKTQKKMDRLKELCAYIDQKIKKYEPGVKAFLESNGHTYSGTESNLLLPLSRKIAGMLKENIKKINFNDPIDVLTKRLTKNKEEFDFFDLQIYLDAKEKAAHIVTFNTQAFQEVNDPSFLEFFANTKILNPDINFKTSTDLNKPSDCKSVFEQGILHDISNDKKAIADLPTITNKLGQTFDSTIMTNYFEKFFHKFEQSIGDAKEIKVILDQPVFEAIDLLKSEGNQLKVDTQLMFKSDIYKEIGAKVEGLQCLKEYLFDSELNIDHFTVPEPSTTAPPQINLLEANFIEAVRAGINDKQLSLQKFLECFAVNRKGADTQTLVRVLYYLTNFDHDRLKGQLFRKRSHPHPIETCPPSGSRRRREISGCKLKWENIEKFNDELNAPKDATKVKINSKKFLDYLKTVEDPDVRLQLYQFANQLINPANGYTDAKLVGNSVANVNRLLNRNKIIEHINRVGQVSGALNTGFFATKIFADFMNDDYKDVAVNVGFFAGDQVLSKVAKVSEIKGAAFVASGKLILGNSMKVASPFISRLGSAFVIYDLVEQTKALKKGDKDAIIRIAGDGIILSVDAIEITLGLLEVTGVIASTGPFAPIAAAIVAVVIIGTEVYFAVKHVERMDKVLHLTFDEKVTEGFASIFNMQSHALEEIKEIKEVNNQLAQNALEFLKKQNRFHRYVFPSAKLNAQNKMVIANTIGVLRKPQSTIQWDRSAPDDPAGGQIFCAQQGEDPNREMPSGVTHECVNAIGVYDLVAEEQETVVFNLDCLWASVEGFSDMDNIFLIAEGLKFINGSNKNDVFILNPNTTDKSLVHIDGFDGINTLDLSEIQMNAIIDLYIEDGVLATPAVHFKNINRFIGRKKQKDKFVPDCKTVYINGQGSQQRKGSDQITIPYRNNCHYNLTIQVDPFTTVANFATEGDFIYKITSVGKSMSILARSPDHLRKLSKFNTNSTHTFFIDYEFSELKAVYFEAQPKTGQLKLALTFKSKEANSVFPVFISLNTQNAIIQLKKKTAIRIQRNGLYAICTTNHTIAEIMDTFSMASRLNMTILVQSKADNTTVIVAGPDQHGILNNDAQRNTVFIANASNANIFQISGVNGKIPGSVKIFSKTKPDTVNTIDLRPIAKQVWKMSGKKLLLLHSIDSQANTIKIEVLEEDSDDTLMTINVVNFEHACENLHVIFHIAPVVLKCDEQHNESNIDRSGILSNYKATDHYMPVPLTFNATSIVAITPHDVEPYTEIIIHQTLGEFAFVQFDESLMFSNAIPAVNSTTYLQNPGTVLLKGFYENQGLFMTLLLKFDDVIISMKDKMKDVESAIILENWLRQV